MIATLIEEDEQPRCDRCGKPDWDVKPSHRGGYDEFGCWDEKTEYLCAECLARLP